ncbi:MAG: hypothetical protein AAGI01_08895 [Myxococcota bacterium]
MRMLRVGTLAVVLFSCLPACAPAIGDTCEGDVNCNAQDRAFCDLSIPNGYCTLANCNPGSCPDDAVCVEFDETTTFCLEACASDNDCRADLSCVDDDVHDRYCYRAPSESS